MSNSPTFSPVAQLNGHHKASQSAPDAETIVAHSKTCDSTTADLFGLVLTFPQVARETLESVSLTAFQDGTPAFYAWRALLAEHEATGAPPILERVETRLQVALLDARDSEGRNGQRAATAIADALENCAAWAGGLPITINDGNAVAVAAGLAKHLVEKRRQNKRFQFARLAEVMTRPDPAFLVHGFLTVGGTSLLTAKHKNFKSFFALDIALCVATGRLWHGQEVKRGPVIYVAAEGSSGLKKRAAAWLAHHDEDLPKDLVILDTPFQAHDIRARADFISEAADFAPSLIILDTLARCAVGLDENNAGDMGQFADAVADLAKKTGAHVMIVHHNNKGGEYRGSSALPAAVDTHLSMERNGDRVTLTSEKQKDAEEWPPLLFEQVVVSIPNTGGNAHSLVFELVSTSAGSKFSLSATEQKVLDELAEGFISGATATKWFEVCEDAGIPRRNFYRAKKRLLALKAVECPDEGARSAKYTANLDWCQSVPVGARVSLAPNQN